VHGVGDVFSSSLFPSFSRNSEISRWTIFNSCLLYHVFIAIIAITFTSTSPTITTSSSQEHSQCHTQVFPHHKYPPDHQLSLIVYKTPPADPLSNATLLQPFHNPSITNPTGIPIQPRRALRKPRSANTAVSCDVISRTTIISDKCNFDESHALEILALS